MSNKFKDLVEKLLSIESEHPEIWEIRDSESGLHIWPFIRYSIFDFILNNIPDVARKNNDPSQINRYKLLGTLLQYYRSNYNIHYPSQEKIAFWGPTYLNVRKGNAFENRMFDYLIKYYPEISASWEFIKESGLTLPRTVSTIKIWDYILLKGYLFKKFYRIHPNTHNITHEISEILLSHTKRINLNIPSAHIIRYINKQINNTLLAFRYTFPSIYSLLERKQLKHLFIHAASYGNIAMLLTLAANVSNINTYELQHGVIADTHIAYNSTYIPQEILQTYYPSKLLLWGEFWKSRIYKKFNSYILGFPYLSEENINTTIPNEQSVHRKIFLIISQWTIREELIEITRRIAENLPNTIIWFKPHPREELFFQQHPNIFSLSNVEIKTGSIYPLIKAANIIIGSYSTALIESALMGKCVLAIKNDISEIYLKGIPNIILVSRNTLFNTLLDSLDFTCKNITSNDKFHQLLSHNWKQNYKNLINT